MRIETHYKGYDISGLLVPESWEGDPSVPGGMHRLSPYIEDIAICVGDKDIYDEASEWFIDECAEELLRAAGERE